MNKKVIFVIGSLTAGKGTQAKLLAEKTGFYHFITSKEGKKYIKTHRDDPETLKQEKIYNAGDLFDPGWLVYKVQKERTREILQKDYLGIIFDGSPRTLYEAENLLKIVADLVGKENVVILEIEVSEEEVVRRTGERLVCDKNENHVVSRRFGDFKIGDRCDKCDGALVKRNLDDVLDERLKEYRTRTVPGIEYLKKHYNVITINGEQSIEDVHKDIMKSLSAMLTK
jgi:adenylate kinase